MTLTRRLAMLGAAGALALAGVAAAGSPALASNDPAFDIVSPQQGTLASGLSLEDAASFCGVSAATLYDDLAEGDGVGSCPARSAFVSPQPDDTGWWWW